MKRCGAWVGCLLLVACGGGQSGDMQNAGEDAGESTSEAETMSDESSEGGVDSSSEGGSTTTGAQECGDLDVLITASGIETHLRAFADHAAANGGNRAAGTPGYDASAAYVQSVLADAGYGVQQQSFDFPMFEVLADPVLEQTAPQPTSFVADDFAVAEFSGAGNVTAPATPVDVQLGSGNNADSGCEAADFDSFSAGDIALIQRGSCTFAQKVAFAEGAGASAVVIFNQGDDGSSNGLFFGTLGAGSNVGIPVVFTTYGLGESLASLPAGQVELHIDVQAITQVVATTNVIVDSPFGDPLDVVMYGAHLDSVAAGPGINDNGTGSAALLEVARLVAQCDLRRTVRFAWWGAEEAGLLGSDHYVAQLQPEARATLRYYLNFDMIGSPNYARMVFDGDGSAFGEAGPGNSNELEALFTEYFGAMGLPTGPARFGGRSDYAAFFAAGIPSGGMFTGAEDVKTSEEEDLFGGAAGLPYDACYHQECDGIENVDFEVAEQITKAIAHSVEVYALD